MSSSSSQLLVPRRQPPTATQATETQNQPVAREKYQSPYDDQYMTTANVANLLGVSTSLLRVWRCRGIGINYVRVNGTGKKIMYPRTAVEAFLRANMVTASRMPRPMGGRLPGGKNRSPAT
jgi:Helix-turn-helix domain